MRHLTVAAQEYDDDIHVVPDFPNIDDDKTGGGTHAQGTQQQTATLARMRPHDMDTFHHENLGMAHLQRARELVKDLEDMKQANV